MAGVGFASVTGEITTGTSLKTILQLTSAANHRSKIRELSISFDGVSNTAAPILVEVLRQSTAGTMSNGATPVKLNDADNETLQITSLINATGEPTAGDVLMSEQVHPQTGYTWQAPFGGEIPIIGGGRLGIRVTAGAAVNAVVRFIGEE